MENTLNRKITQIDERTFKTRLCRRTNGFKEQHTFTFELDRVYSPEIAMKKAQLKREELKAMYQRNELQPEQYCKSIADVYVDFINYYRSYYSPETAEFYCKVIQNDIIPIVGRKPISMIGQADLQKFIDRLVRNNPLERTHTRVAKPLSGTTIRRYETCFCEFLQWCVKKRYAQEYKIRRADIDKPKAEEKIVNYYSCEEFFELINALKTRIDIPIEDRLLVAIDVLTGLRRGEIVALTWNDWQGDKFYVRKAATQTVGEKQKLKITKGYAQREAYLPDVLIELLDEYQSKLMLDHDYNPNNRIFRGKNTKVYLNADVAGDRIKKTTQNLVGREMQAHGLRHTYATILSHLSTPDSTVQRMLGHKQIDTTRRYIHTYDESMRGSVERLNGLIKEREVAIETTDET